MSQAMRDDEVLPRVSEIGCSYEERNEIFILK
jgi:hypothetical protein